MAGLQAIATAGRLGAEVEAFDIRPEVADEVRSLGATFIEAEDEQESANEESEDDAGPDIGRTESFVKALLGLPPEFGRWRERKRAAENGQGGEEEPTQPQGGYASEQGEDKQRRDQELVN